MDRELGEWTISSSRAYTSTDVVTDAGTSAFAQVGTKAGAHTSTDASTDASIDAIAQPVSTPSAFDSGWAGTPKIADRLFHQRQHRRRRLRLHQR